MNHRARIALCDDREEDRNYIGKIVRDWAADAGEEVEIRMFPSAEAFLFAYEEEKDYVLLLLDIEMGKMNGVALAKKIREQNPSVQIVFITGYSDYIAEGYEVEALHYLMKPVREEKLREVLTRAFQRFRKNERMILLECAGGVELLPVRSIRYLEVFRNYTSVYSDAGTFTVRKTLSEFEKELSDPRFFRASRSLLVNLLEIRRISREEIFMKDGTVIQLPRGKYEDLNRALIERL